MPLGCFLLRSSQPCFGLKPGCLGDPIACLSGVSVSNGYHTMFRHYAEGIVATPESGGGNGAGTTVAAAAGMPPSPQRSGGNPIVMVSVPSSALDCRRCAMDSAAVGGFCHGACAQLAGWRMQAESDERLLPSTQPWILPSNLTTNSSSITTNTG
jgi:hypothetical protein